MAMVCSCTETDGPTKESKDTGSGAWYVLRTHVRKEVQVDRFLQHHGLDTFLPMKDEGGRGGTLVGEPFFPSYLFFRLQPFSNQWPLVRWAPGAKHVVAFDGVPASVPDKLVTEIRHRLSNRSQGGAMPLFQRGERIQITTGPLAGLDAIFDEGLTGARRASVLIEIVGRLVRTQVAVEHLRRIR
ncbi:MAG TPA: transcription termination/antitermination NusG family protein [Chloroflexota bacterium]|nr:transcription termination/antitermination NusG family protein [Chloroflexota bacterium]